MVLSSWLNFTGFFVAEGRCRGAGTGTPDQKNRTSAWEVQLGRGKSYACVGCGLFEGDQHCVERVCAIVGGAAVGESGFHNRVAVVRSRGYFEGSTGAEGEIMVMRVLWCCGHGVSRLVGLFR